MAELWRRGSVISSWLLDLSANALSKDPGLENFSGKVSDSGEGRWTNIAAIEAGVPVHVLSAALYDRFNSRDAADFGNQLLSAMRFEFGGHHEKQTEREMNTLDITQHYGTTGTARRHGDLRCEWRPRQAQTAACPV